MFSYKIKIVAALALLAVGFAQANPTVGRVSGMPLYTFSAVETSPGVVTTLTTTARTSFLGLFDNTVQSYGFEGSGPIPSGSTLDVEFAGSNSTTITASLVGAAGQMIVGAPNEGRFNTTSGGSRYWQVNSDGSGSFSISFDNAISAFGFYGTDIGDFGGVLKLVLTPSDNLLPDEELIVRPQTTLPADNGLALFYAFGDPNKTYSRVTFESTGTTSIADYFGFDDFIVADRGQFLAPNPNPTPEPGSLALAGLALLAAGWARRARRSA